jgi:hypothetical protein
MERGVARRTLRGLGQAWGRVAWIYITVNDYYRMYIIRT